MGDNGRMYVPKELLPIYKEVIVPIADIITPNQFELELLTDRKIASVSEAWDAIDLLHEKGCKIVVLSSTELGDENFLLGLASSNAGKILLCFQTPATTRNLKFLRRNCKLRL